MNTLKTLIIAAQLSLLGMSGAMAEESINAFPELNSLLQTKIDEKVEASLQEKPLHFGTKSYVSLDKVKTNKAS